MKRIFLITGVLAACGAAFCALNSAARSNQQKLAQARIDWMEQTQKLTQAQSDIEAVSERVRDLKDRIPPISRDAALIDLLSTNDFKDLSQEQQGTILSQLGASARSADNYVIIAKPLLANSQVKAFGAFPNGSQLTPEAKQILAISPDEQKSVEGAFADALQREADWARAHIQRSGASNDMLVSYTLPVDTNFANGLQTELYGTISNVLGAQRTQLLQHYFDNYRVDEDGALAVNTNKLMIYRVQGKVGLFYRAGWDTGGWAAMNTDPEPVRTNRFPAAFRFTFPGGWQELAQREGLEWVDPATEK